MDPFPARDWWDRAIEIGEYVIGALVTAASSVVLYFGRDYHNHKNMVRRHDERLDDAERELGEQKKFREQMKSGPAIEAMAQNILKLEAEDQRLHRRISESRQKTARLEKVMVAMRTDLKWIRKALGDKEANDE